MATMREMFAEWRGGPLGRADSTKAREVVRKAYEKSGGPTPELKRVYGEFLRYKRGLPAAKG